MTEPRAATSPAHASTVVVARRGAGGVEVLCVERRRGGVFGGAVVFPGGKLDATDRDPAWAWRTTGISERARALGDSEADALALAVTALRETLEEAAVVAATGGSLDSAKAAELRDRAGAHGLLAALEHHDLSLDTVQLDALGRWITPTREPRRFDTRFYLLALPAGQEGVLDARETTRCFWASPAELLRTWQEGGAFLMPPTVYMLGLLEACDSIASARQVAARQSLAPVLPCFVDDGETGLLVLPGDPAYPLSGPPGVDPEGPTRFVLEGNRLVPRRPPSRR